MYCLIVLPYYIVLLYCLIVLPDVLPDGPCTLYSVRKAMHRVNNRARNPQLNRLLATNRVTRHQGIIICNHRLCRQGKIIWNNRYNDTPANKDEAAGPTYSRSLLLTCGTPLCEYIRTGGRMAKGCPEGRAALAIYGSVRYGWIKPVNWDIFSTACAASLRPLLGSLNSVPQDGYYLLLRLTTISFLSFIHFCSDLASCILHHFHILIYSTGTVT